MPVADYGGPFRSLWIVALLILGPLALLAGPSAAEPNLEITSEPLPRLPEWLAPLLAGAGLRIVDGESTLAEFWLRLELPAQDPTGELGVQYGTLPQGVLVGVVRFEQPWKDYRNQPIQPGVYTMRYGLQPADGDHTGQTWFRDFLMLLPVDEDVFVADRAEAEPMVAASKVVSGTVHPAVVALYPVYEEFAEAAMTVNDLDQPMLAIPMGVVTLGITVEGHGPELTL